MLNAIAKFFDEITLSNAAWSQTPTMEFEFRATGLMVAIDTGAAIEYSFDGQTRHGKIYSSDKFASFDDIDDSKIWIRKVGEDDCSIRVWAWEKKK